MANTLRFKRGLASGIPTGVAGEPLFTTDTFDLYIGNGTTNTRFQKYIASGTTSQYLRGDGSLATFPSLTGFVPYTGATANVDLGTHTILAQNATIASSGSGNTATITHSSGSGIALNITKGGNGEGLYINKTSGTGNAATIIGTLNATTLVKSGGTSTQYLMADGSVSTLTNPITGTGTAGQVAYFTGATTQAGSNNLFWDTTNLRLGIGTNTPGGNLDVRGSANPQIRVSDGTITTKMQSVTSLAAYIGTESNHQLRLITNNTPQITIFGGGNVHVGGTSDAGQRLQVTGTGYFSDRLMVGTTSNILNNSFQVGRQMTGAVTNNGINSYGQIQSDVTSEARYYISDASTQAATFTLNSLIHYRTFQSTFGAGSTVTNQYGFYIDATLTGATNNYGFFGNIASGTNRWNLYMNGTANNYMAGSLGIGSTSFFSATKLQVSGASANCGIVSNDTTSTGSFVRILGDFSSQNLINWTNGTALRFASSTSSFGTFTEHARFTTLGNLHIGTFSSDSGEKLQVTGNVKITGSLNTSSNAFIGVNGGANYIAIAGDASSNGAFLYADLNQFVLSMVPSQPIVFRTGNTEKMRLDASGNLGLGVTPSAWTAGGKNIEVGSAGNIIQGQASQIAVIQNATFNSGWKYSANGFASFVLQTTGQHQWFTAPSGTAGNAITFTQPMTLTAAGRLILGAGDSGELLQVNGTAKITGATTTSDYINVNTTNGFTVGALTNRRRIQYGSDAATSFSLLTDANSFAGLYANEGVFSGNLTVDTNTLFVDATNNRVGIGLINPRITSEISATLSAPTALSSNTAAGNLLLSDGGNVGMVLGIYDVSSTYASYIQARNNLGSNNIAYNLILNPLGGNVGIGVSPTEKLHVSGNTIITGNLTVDTNTLFVDATNNRVGILTNTPSEPLHVAGNILISGANSYKVRNLAGNDVNVLRSVTGGTNTLSSSSVGNHIAVGTVSAHDFLLCSNDTERIRLSNEGWFSHINATNPSSSVTDSYVQYSADVVAGNAAPHFRTENGAVIKLYQETTSVGNSTISLGGGLPVLDDTEFGGYTLRQVVKALQNQGILA